MLSKTDLAARYIALLKKSLINELYIENEARVALVVDSLLNRRAFELGHLSGIGREVALLSVLRKAKDDSVVANDSWVPLIENVASLEIRYFDPRINVWADKWTDAVDYLKGKKFSDNEILEAGLAKKNERGSLSDKFRNRIMIPIRDADGWCVSC